MNIIIQMYVNNSNNLGFIYGSINDNSDSTAVSSECS